MLKFGSETELCAELVNLKWFVETIKAKKPVPVSDDHRLKNELKTKNETGIIISSAHCNHRYINL